MPSYGRPGGFPGITRADGPRGPVTGIAPGARFQKVRISRAACARAPSDDLGTRSYQGPSQMVSGSPWKCPSPVRTLPPSARVVERMMASASPGRSMPRDFALPRRSSSASATPRAMSMPIGVNWLRVEISLSLRSTTGRVTPSRASLRATSARTKSGVTTTSASESCARMAGSREVPPRNSIQANESTISIKAVCLSKAGHSTFEAPGQPFDEGRALQLEHRADGLIRRRGLECTLETLELGQGVPRDSNGRRSAHSYIVYCVTYMSAPTAVAPRSEPTVGLEAVDAISTQVAIGVGVKVLPAGFEPALSGRRPEILDRTRLRERDHPDTRLGLHNDGAAVPAPGTPKGERRRRRSAGRFAQGRAVAERVRKTLPCGPRGRWTWRRRVREVPASSSCR